MANFDLKPGSAHPVGITVYPDGVNFSMFSENATEIALLLFDRYNAIEPVQTIRLDPFVNKTFHFWHVLRVRLRPRNILCPSRGWPGQSRSRPAVQSEQGADRSLYARALQEPLETCGRRSVRKTISPRRCAARLWTSPLTTGRAISRLSGRSMNRSSMRCTSAASRARPAPAKHPGTFAGCIEKIPYLQALGVTAVELLPVFEFDDTDETLDPTGQVIRNYWGYSTVGFFSPHSGYCVDRTGASRVNEFRDW